MRFDVVICFAITIILYSSYRQFIKKLANNPIAIRKFYGYITIVMILGFGLNFMYNDLSGAILCAIGIIGTSYKVLYG